MLDKLEKELELSIASSESTSKPVDLDEAIGRISRIDAIQNQKIVAANRRSMQLRLKLVRAAQTALDNDDYGFCRVCDDNIAYGRLKAKPEATMCVQCQSKRETRR